jgi:hypothetical protein
MYTTIDYKQPPTPFVLFLSFNFMRNNA